MCLFLHPEPENSRNSNSLSNKSKQQKPFFSIDVDSILKSKGDYLTRISEIQKSNGRTFYLVEMRHKVAKLTDGRQPIIQLRIAEDNWMVYSYRLTAADSTEIAHAFFEYVLLQKFWLPVKSIIRLYHTGDVITDLISYSHIEGRK